MAPSLANIESLLSSLMGASSEPALAEAAELESLAAASGHPTPLRAWDRYFWSERLRETRFGLKDDEVRPYFPFEGVLKALFSRSSALFGVRIEPADGTVPVWHPDVRYFNIFRGTERIASFFLDAFARPGEKRGGAWMNPLLARSCTLSSGDSVRCPVAVLVCNQTPPVDDIPSLLTFREVETLFHEFGHGLHHMLTTVDERMVAGISGVEWDAVELPSMWMEGWCTHRPTLQMMARHYDTGEPMPEALLEQLMAAKNFRAATGLRGQLGWTRVDLALHAGAPPSDPLEVQQAILGECWQSGALDGDMWICSFNHIFGGSSYAAAYYSYLWAEVLATDAFSAFEEVDPEDEPALTALGQRFWAEVLSVGGSRHPMENFSAFRGRPPSTDALLRAKGLAATQA
jgi:oligopeptidase A